MLKPLFVSLAFALALTASAEPPLSPKTEPPDNSAAQTTADYPLLDKLFKEALTPEQFTTLGEQSALKDRVAAMSASQKANAKEKLVAAEAQAKTSKERDEIAHGYALLGDREAAQRIAAATLKTNPDDQDAQKIALISQKKLTGKTINTDGVKNAFGTRSAEDLGKSGGNMPAGPGDPNSVVNAAPKKVALDASVVPPETPVNPGSPSPAQGHWPLVPLGSAAAGLTIFGYGLSRSGKPDEAGTNSSQSDEVYKPSFFSDPIGVIADYGFRAKTAIEDHPISSLTTGAVVLGSTLYFGVPMLIGSGGEGALALAGGGSTGGTVIVQQATVVGAAKVGVATAGTVYVAKVASDHIPLATSDSGNADGGDNGRRGTEGKNHAPDFHPDQADHIFGNRPGHLPDTPENRKLLLDTAADTKNLSGVDKYGNQWYARLLENGKQIWVEVWKDGTIRNAGMNETPRPLPPK
jgi:hypothetical protein